MLEINLLPPERRKRERTPLPRFIILLVGVALITSEVAVIVIGYMNWQQLIQERQSLEDKRQGLQPAVDQYEKLKKEISQLKKRREVLNEIRPKGLKEKYQWSYALDRLLTVIDNSPGVWIEGLQGKMDQRGQKGAGSGLSLSFQVKAAEPLDRLTSFQRLMKRKLIQEDQVFTNFERVWHNFQSGEDEQEGQRRGFWQAKYTLKRIKD